MAPDQILIASVMFNSCHLKQRKQRNRRFEAAAWLQSMVGSNLGIPCEPSEEEFRLCLRNGIILCNLLNKVQPGTVSKVVVNRVSAYQYFENVQNFLASVKEMKLPTFEASQLEQESLQLGSTKKIVDCVLALKACYEWKQYGGPFEDSLVPRKTWNFLQQSTPMLK